MCEFVWVIVLISVSIFDKANSNFLLRVEPHKAVAGGCETEVDIFGVPVHPGTLHLPFFSAIIIGWAVVSRQPSGTGTEAAVPFLLFFSYATAIVELGRPFFAPGFFHFSLGLQRYIT